MQLVALYATGAVEERSIVEPIRRPIAAKGWKYYEAACIDVDAKAKKITCRAADTSFDNDRGANSCEWRGLNKSNPVDP